MGLAKRIKMAFSPSFDKIIKSFYSGNEININGRAPIDQNIAMHYSVFFACMRVLAETFASVPIFEYKKSADGDRIQTNDTGFLDIWHGAANSEMSSYNFKESLMYQINLGGYGIAERLRNMYGQTIGLYPIEWQSVRIDRDEFTKKLVYIIDGTRKLNREDVFHVPGPSTNGIIGMSILEFASSAIRLGSTYETYGQKFYDNGATPSGVFEAEGHYKDEAYNRLKADLKTNYTGLLNSGKPMLLEDGLKYKQLTISPVDAQLLESKKFSTEEICRFFRMPLHLIQNLDKATFSNIEYQSLEFIMYTMLPHFKRVEENINTQLLTKQQRDQGYYFEFNIASLLRGDQKSMADAFSVGRQWGWLSVNDIRRMLNMNKIEGGDTYLEPLNMKPVGETAQEQMIDDTEEENNDTSVDKSVSNEIAKILKEVK